MSENKPQPLFVPAPRKLCPVCGTPSYSRGGVHPQCSQRQADARSDARLKTKKSAPAATSAASLQVWQKRCPQCRSVLHVRKVECPCGHQFARTAKPAAE